MLLNASSIKIKYNTKLLRNAVAQPVLNQAKVILKNATTSVPLKYLSNFWKSLEMPFINCKVELKLRWIKHCVLSVLGDKNNDANVDSTNIIFTIKDTKSYVPVVTLSAKGNQKLLIGMNMKQKLGTKILQTSTDILLNETLWELTDCLFCFIETKMVVLKNLMAERHCQQKKTFTTNVLILI